MIRRLPLPLRAIPAALVLLLCLAVPASAATGPCRPADPASPTCTVWKAKVVFVADGDTLDVDVLGDGSPRISRIRVTGLQAMEQTRYSKYPRRRRGECHALAATARAERLIGAGRGIVRLAAQHSSSMSGYRLRRAVAVRAGGRWRELAEVLLAGGHALWLPNPVEHAWNDAYRQAALRAAAERRRLWNPSSCRPGPSATAQPDVGVNWDAAGRDDLNLNGEWITVRNAGSAPLRLGGWWVRDSHLRRYAFPSWAEVPPGGRIRVHVGSGSDDGASFHWGLPAPAFENVAGDGRGMGDGAYLFDPDGDLRAWSVYPGPGDLGDDF